MHTAEVSGDWSVTYTGVQGQHGLVGLQGEVQLLGKGHDGVQEGGQARLGTTSRQLNVQ